MNIVSYSHIDIYTFRIFRWSPFSIYQPCDLVFLNGRLFIHGFSKMAVSRRTTGDHWSHHVVQLAPRSSTRQPSSSWWMVGTWPDFYQIHIKRYVYEYLGGDNSNIFLCSSRKLGKIFSNLTIIFVQRGWFNHQLGMISNISICFMYIHVFIMYICVA